MMTARIGHIKILILMLAMLPNALFALSFSMSENGDNVVGYVQRVQAKFGDDANQICRRYHVGFLGLVAANPQYNWKEGMHRGWNLTLPTEYVLPDAQKEGIVINRAELRLYYFPPHTDTVMIFPIGIGREGDMTPTMKTRIIEKTEDPSWTPTDSERERMASLGVILPEKVEAGPGNPMGEFALRLGLPTYLIHGTNRPEGIGKRVTAGCIRMYPEDIEALFSLVKIGTPVEIVDQPFKVGWRNHGLYLEAHAPISDEKKFTHAELLHAMTTIVTPVVKDAGAEIDWSRALSVLEAQQGIPVKIGVKRI